MLCCAWPQRSGVKLIRPLPTPQSSPNDCGDPDGTSQALVGFEVLHRFICWYVVKSMSMTMTMMMMTMRGLPWWQMASAQDGGARLRENRWTPDSRLTSFERLSHRICIWFLKKISLNFYFHLRENIWGPDCLSGSSKCLVVMTLKRMATYSEHPRWSSS